jgi:putative ABC transport system permease protein
MATLAFSMVTQTLTFLPLALGISVSYTILRATDMTLDGSFVLGAAIFARLVTLGVDPYTAALASLAGGGAAGMMVGFIQRGGRVDPLLAGILAGFILTSFNLILMGRPNINLLSEITLVSQAFALGDLYGWLLIAFFTGCFCLITYLLLCSRFGLALRALGDNPAQLQRLGKNIEFYRMLGFAFTNMLAAASGILTAQTVGYADISMGFGMTLTGIGAIIIGQQLIRIVIKKSYMRIFAEISACIMGVLIYFFAINTLLRFNVDPIYLKMVLGITLIIFIRGAVPRGKNLS